MSHESTLNSAMAFLAALILAGSGLATECVVPSPGASTPITLRASPAASSAPRGTLDAGANLPLIASVPGWYETRLANGQMAFASKHSTDLAACRAPIFGAGSAAAGPGSTTGAVTYELHAIDVGTGLSLLIRGPDFNVLYDAGSNDDTATGDKNRTLAYLKTLDPPITSLDHVILSHPHRDHVELMPDVMTKLKPHEVWNSGAYNDTCGYRNFLLAIAADPSVQYHTGPRMAAPRALRYRLRPAMGTTSLHRL
jgi:beta-lactamase superfamily II metal-dependent hydrolase